MKAGQAVSAVVLALSTGGMIGAVIYLMYVFPKTLQVHKDQGQELSASLKLAANVSEVCMSYGWLILPIFLLGFLASLVWPILAIMKKSAANNEVPAMS